MRILKMILKIIVSTTGRAMLAALAALGISGCSVDPPTTVSYVDVQKYMGKWYEIAKYPFIFECGLVGVTAEYSLNDDGTVKVVNKGFKKTLNGDVSSAEAKATVADTTTNAKLNVQFGPIPMNFLGPNYWIIDLGENYEYAVVSDRLRLTLWILCRTPQMDEAVYNEIVARLEGQGYDKSRLERMLQPTE
jgi:apolipoprotein D and lipocalin family protein